MSDEPATATPTKCVCTLTDWTDRKDKPELDRSICATFAGTAGEFGWVCTTCGHEDVCHPPRVAAPAPVPVAATECFICCGPTVSDEIGRDVLQGDPNGEVCIRFAGTSSQLCRELTVGFGDHGLAALVGRIYDHHGAGCCLHIAIDDGNLDDDDVDFCIGVARERGHKLCENAATMLRAVPAAERRDCWLATGTHGTD